MAREALLAETLDAIDAKILDLIQHDAGLSVAEIAERVGLSSSPAGGGSSGWRMWASSSAA